MESKTLTAPDKIPYTTELWIYRIIDWLNLDIEEFLRKDFYHAIDKQLSRCPKECIHKGESYCSNCESSYQYLVDNISPIKNKYYEDNDKDEKFFIPFFDIFSKDCCGETKDFLFYLAENFGNETPATIFIKFLLNGPLYPSELLNKLKLDAQTPAVILKALPYFKRLYTLQVKNMESFNAKIPLNVKELIIKNIGNFNTQIPLNVKKLIVKNTDNIKVTIPSSVAELKLTNCKNFPEIPAKVKKITLCDYTNLDKYIFNENIIQGDEERRKELIIDNCQKFTKIPNFITKLIIKNCKNFTLCENNPHKLSNHILLHKNIAKLKLEIINCQDIDISANNQIDSIILKECQNFRVHSHTVAGITIKIKYCTNGLLDCSKNTTTCFCENTDFAHNDDDNDQHPGRTRSNSFL